MSLRYNISWIERTFSTQAAVESLLGPEHSAGTISSVDYERARNFLPGFHKYYGIIGGGCAAPAVLVARRPNWSNARVYAMVTAASFTGFMIGRAMTLSAHVKFVRSIQDPAGFARALQNVQDNSGIHVPRGPEIVRQFDDLESSADNQESTPQDSWEIQAAKQEATPPLPTAATPQKASRWEAIRAANSPAAKDSSWDKLRQNHERSKVPSSPDTESNAQRKLEQAEFDALLERERNIHNQGESI